MIKMGEDVVFRKKLRDIGNILGISLPPELVEFIEAKKDDQLLLVAKTDSSGKGIFLWKEDGQDENRIS